MSDRQSPPLVVDAHPESMRVLSGTQYAGLGFEMLTQRLQYYNLLAAPPLPVYSWVTQDFGAC